VRLVHSDERRFDAGDLGQDVGVGQLLGRQQQELQLAVPCRAQDLGLRALGLRRAEPSCGEPRVLEGRHLVLLQRQQR
jgi:hypothetical protein